MSHKRSNGNLVHWLMLFIVSTSNNLLPLKMKPRANGIARGVQKSKISGEGQGPNWILIAGGALLSTLSIRLGYKLRQALDNKQSDDPSNASKGNGKSTSQQKKLRGRRLQSNAYSFTQDEDGCYNCISGSEGTVEIKHPPPNGHIIGEADVELPLVTVPPAEYNKENGVMWSSSPDRLDLAPPKPFHHSNCSDSPRVSDSGSDIFSKREVIYKLRQQLKRRDDMIMEMQDQIMELQNSLSSHSSHSAHLQSQLDSTNRDLLNSEREIQRLRKAIADHCVSHNSSSPPKVTIWPLEARNGYGNGFMEENGRGNEEIIEMLKREVGELKELMEGKEYLLQNYKEQKAELMKELQQKLDSQIPNIL